MKEKKRMTKQELVKKTAYRIGCGPKHATRFLNAVLYVISQTLERGESVRISDFGTFTVKNDAARAGRNLQTGERIRSPTIRRVVFSPGKALKLS